VLRVTHRLSLAHFVSRKASLYRDTKSEPHANAPLNDVEEPASLRPAREYMLNAEAV